jgi:hypothetical protein
MLVAASEVPTCEDLYAAAEAIASLIAEFCPIVRAAEKWSKAKQYANMVRVAGLVALGAIPDCQELFQAAATIQQLIADNCPTAKPNVLESTRGKK